MKKLWFCLFTLACGYAPFKLQSQVFGHTGATWVFHSPEIFAVCFEYYEKWEYINDTMVAGDTCMNVRMTRKLINPLSGTVQTTLTHYFYKTTGDTVSIYDPAHGWMPVYNFGVVPGDWVVSPLVSPLNQFYLSCPDSSIYTTQALVIDTGMALVDGQNLRYYTVQYVTGAAGDTAQQTFYERMITQSYMYAWDMYWCGAVAECESPLFMCYKDQDMMTGSGCDDLTWFETLHTEQEAESQDWRVYPNPATDYLYFGTTVPESTVFTIISMDGKVKRKAVLSNGALYVGNLAAGMYLLTNDNATVYTRWVKQSH